MSWIGDIIRKRLNKNAKWAPTLSGFSPIYSQYGDNVYADETVQQCINCIVGEMKKLKITHVMYKGSDPVPIADDLQRVLESPNQLMTQADFIEKVAWLLLLNYNAFIIPVYTVIAGKKVYRALYPVKPSQVDFIDQEGTLLIKFRFANGYESTIRYSDVIHIRTHFSLNDYMGGNEAGQPDNRALLDTIATNDDLIKGVAKSLKSSYAVHGVIKHNSLLDSEALDKALHDLEQKLANNESGFLPIDLKSDFTPIEHKAQVVGEETLAFFDKKILRHFRTSEAILTGDYDKVQYSAWYQGCIEPLVIAFSQAFTKTLFTDSEKREGHKIEFYPEDLVFMTPQQILQMINLLSATGALYENEKRAAFGLRPLPELEGKRFVSLNWVDADMANEYQMQRASGAGTGTNIISSKKSDESEGVE